MADGVTAFDEQGPLRFIGRQTRSRRRTRDEPRRCAQVVRADRRARRHVGGNRGIRSGRRSARAVAGPWTSATAIARLRMTTGVARGSSVGRREPRSGASRCRRPRRRHCGQRRWQPVFGTAQVGFDEDIRERCLAPRRSTPGPRANDPDRLGAQVEPSAPTRPGARATSRSINASSPATSGSSAHQFVQQAA